MIDITDEESLKDWMIGLPAKLKHENEFGGDLVDLPCPYCHKPRSQRSSYVRCQPCGKNWMPGQPLDKHPHYKAPAELPDTEEPRP